MRRREFLGVLGGAAAAWPLTARAQQGERVRHIGVLGGVNSLETQDRMEAFRQGLAQLAGTTAATRGSMPAGPRAMPQSPANTQPNWSRSRRMSSLRLVALI